MRFLLLAALTVGVLAAVMAACFYSSGFGQPPAASLPGAGLPDDLKTLVQRLDSPDAVERAEALLAIERLPSERAGPVIPELRRLLPDRTRLRLEAGADGIEHAGVNLGGVGYFTCPGAIAARVLARSGEAGVQTLLAAIRERDFAIRRSGIEGTVSASDPRLLTAAVKAQGDEDGMVRDDARATLAYVGAPAVDALVAGLHDADPQVRRSSAAVLSEIEDPGAMKMLLLAMKDPDENVRLAAGLGLAMPDSRRCTGTLIHLLGDEAVRREAGEVLARSRYIERTPLVVEALSGPDPHIRAGAAYALAVIGDPATARALRAATQDSSPEVRREASEALAMLTRSSTSGP